MIEKKYLDFSKMNKDISKFLRVKKNEIQMMLDRGYELNQIQRNFITSEADNILRNVSDINNSKTIKSLRKELNKITVTNNKIEIIDFNNLNIYSKIIDGFRKFTIIAHSGMKVTNNDDLVEFQNLLVEFVKQYIIERCIYVSYISVGTGAKNVSDVLKANYACQFFTEKQLSYNTIQHNMVPKHRLLNEQEKIKVLNDLRISINHMPQILIEDPVIKWYGWSTGNIVEISRTDPPGGLYYDYRIIVNRNWVD